MKISWNNKVLRKLPIDPERQIYPREVPGACFSRVKPTPVINPTIAAVSPAALLLINVPLKISQRVAPPESDADTSQTEQYAVRGTRLDTEEESHVNALRDQIKVFFSGNDVFDGSEPSSHVYCGHQFGSFAGQLGDGAAIYLGEATVETPEAAEAAEAFIPRCAGNSRWEVQLKGAGLTPFSRTADGRKVLRSSIREFLCSEAMFALGIPTTRAASIVTSDSRVERDPLYTGKVISERCSIVSRVAQTFIRFGSFEVCRMADDESDREGPSAAPEYTETVLLPLYEYVAEEFFTPIVVMVKQEMLSQGMPPPSINTKWHANAAPLIFEDIVKRTAELVAKWQAFGWCHGVLNTDNMSIIGLTIDYGPFGFMTHYDEDHVCNLSDHGGRYSFKKQPEICRWNLTKLSEAWGILFPELKESSFDKCIAEVFDDHFNKTYRSLMRRKLGFGAVMNGNVGNTDNNKEYSKDSLNFGNSSEVSSSRMQVSDEDFDITISAIIDAFNKTGADYTQTFRALMNISVEIVDANKIEEHIETIASFIAENLCISSFDRITIVKRRLTQLRTRMDLEQIEQLLDMANTKPQMLRSMFEGAVDTVSIVAFLTEEKKKCIVSRVYYEELKCLMSELEEERKEHVATCEGEKKVSVDSEEGSCKVAEQPRRTKQKIARDKKVWKKALTIYHSTLLNAVRFGGGKIEQQRKVEMSQYNPIFVLYPWILEDVIKEAEKGSMYMLRSVLDRSMTPYAADARDGVLWSLTAPKGAAAICVSCSS